MTPSEGAAYFNAMAQHFGVPDESPAMLVAMVERGQSTRGRLQTRTSSVSLEIGGTSEWPTGALELYGQLVDEEPAESEHAYMPLDGVGTIKAYGAVMRMMNGTVAVSCSWPLGGAKSVVQIEPTQWTPSHFTAAERALRWLEGIGRERGRPRGGGSYPDEAAFRAAVEPWIRSLRAEGKVPTKDRVAELLSIEPRHLQRLCKTLVGSDWGQFAQSVE